MLWPSSIRHRDSNPRPLEHESPPITTRPGLPPLLLLLLLDFSFEYKPITIPPLSLSLSSYLFVHYICTYLPQTREPISFLSTITYLARCSQKRFLYLTKPEIVFSRPSIPEGVTTLMIACQQGLEHDVRNIILKKVGPCHGKLLLLDTDFQEESAKQLLIYWLQIELMQVIPSYFIWG